MFVFDAAIHEFRQAMEALDAWMNVMGYNHFTPGVLFSVGVILLFPAGFKLHTYIYTYI